MPFFPATLCAASTPPDNASSMVTSLLENVTAKMEKELSSTVGGAGAIIHKNEIVYLKTFGKTYKKGISVTDKTFFALGSVSKPICAFVAVDVAKSTKIDLQGPIAIDVISGPPMVPITPQTIQLEHVLAHTSGFFYKGNNDIELGKNREIILSNLFSSKSKKNPRPGEKFLYNNAAFSLLENAVEKFSGIPWPTVFARTMGKHGLDQIALTNPPPDVEVAHPHHYVRRGRRFIDLGPVPRNYPQTVSSAAGVYASIQGLIQFMKLQLSGQFNELHGPKVLAKGGVHFGRVKLPCPRQYIRSQYALGWRVMDLVTDKDMDTRMIFHGGWLNGVNAFIGFMPKHELAIMILANDDRFIPQTIGLYFWTQVVAPILASGPAHLLATSKPVAQIVKKKRKKRKH